MAIAPLENFPVIERASFGVAIEPVQIEIVRRCDWKRKPCGRCGKPRTNRAHDKGGTCTFAQRNGCANCGLAKLHRDHFGQPPSVNIFGSGSPLYFQDIKRAWSTLLTELIAESGLPKGLLSVVVEGEVTFPRPATAKGPDQGNFRGPLEKICGDVLESEGYIPNDNWEHYSFGGLEYRHEPSVSRTRLLLFPRARDDR